MKYFRTFSVATLITYLFISVFTNNFWQLMPTFHYLDTLFATPLYIQCTFFVCSVIIGALFLRLKNSFFLTLSFLVSFVLTIASGYHINLSNSSNSLSINLYPFYEKSIPFKDIKIVTLENYTSSITTQSEKVTVYTGHEPLGIDHIALHKTLTNYGNCIDKKRHQCSEIAFNWPL